MTTRPWLADGDVTLWHGEVVAVLAQLPAESVQTVVTSPPYWGLRDYGTGSWVGGDAECPHRVGGQVEDTKARGAIVSGVRPGVDASRCLDCGAVRVDDQFGLEPTPEAYVERLVGVFREVWRVLRRDGTVWLNLGDSYAHSMRQSGAEHAGTKQNTNGGSIRSAFAPLPAGLKEKDLVGIPWRVAFALQQPWYAGTIKRESDRAWLAAMIDAEGCMYVHKRGVGLDNGRGYTRKTATYGSGMEISNCHESIIQRIVEITGRGSVSVQTEGRKQPLYRWNLRTNECREVIREVYPYLIGKQHQARIAYGCPSSGERAEAAHEALKLLHQGGSTTVDFAEPESCFTPGWYLRSDIVWAKPNPMPESVSDRPTKAHEYLFLLAKQPRYYMDMDSIREPLAYDTPARVGRGSRYDDPLVAASVPYSASRPRIRSGNKERKHGEAVAAPGARPGDLGRSVPWEDAGVGRNKRSVWTVPTQPVAEAHFATFPQALVEPCVLAGTSERGECVECGAPWVREVDTTYTPGGGAPGKVGSATEDMHGWGRARLSERLTRHDETTGWRASCDCNAATRPQMVLDPFVGSGTTALVARRHGRQAVGIDLNEDYLRIAARRLRSPALERVLPPDEEVQLSLLNGSD